MTLQAWIAGQSATELFITTVTEAELRYAIGILPPGQRREQLQIALSAMFEEDFAVGILSFDSAAAIARAPLAADRRRTGRPSSQMDAQIAAIASSKLAPLAPRNIADFQGCGIAIIDPWRLGLDSLA
jgi:predicted nucleic acid-binding protein